MSCIIAIPINSPVFTSPSSNPFSRVSLPSTPSPFDSSSTGFNGSFDLDGPSTSNSSASPAVTVPVLKRKRPTMLDIPVGGSLGGFGPQVPATPKGAQAIEDQRDGYYAVYCKRGKRRAAMEDRYSVALNVHGDSKQAFFGVFDGHGGSKASEFAAKNLGDNILDELARRKNNDHDKADVYTGAVRDGYLRTDSDFLKEDTRGGSCCVTALVSNGNLVVSNAGDCRAVVSRGGKAEALTTDHRPSREDEKDRIEATGGYVDCYRGVWRIQGSLAVSRGIGDGHLKKWVIAEPETTIHRIDADSEFLILASDGLWDKVTDQEAVDIARTLCMGTEKAADPLAACKKLAEISTLRGSCDDTSVMLIQLQQYLHH